VEAYGSGRGRAGGGGESMFVSAAASAIFAILAAAAFYPFYLFCVCFALFYHDVLVCHRGPSIIISASPLLKHCKNMK